MKKVSQGKVICTLINAMIIVIRIKSEHILLDY